MGLIEKAVGGGIVSTPSGERLINLDKARGFDLDFDLLRSKGVFTPQVREEAQAFELRAIKRRLLRRIGFLQRAGRDKRQLAAAGRNRNVILLTSTRPGEGKSFVAVNLAMSLVIEEGLPVILVDGDPARPRLRSYFNLPAEAGLTDLIKNPGLTLGDVAYKAEGLPLTFVGEGGRIPNATDLFGSADARRLFATLSALCPDGLVIVDAPPMLATTETIALARQVDEVVFVVEADSTPQPAVASALDELLEINPNVSLVLNRCLVPAGGAHYAAYEYYEKSSGDAGGGENTPKKGT